MGHGDEIEHLMCSLHGFYYGNSRDGCPLCHEPVIDSAQKEKAMIKFRKKPVVIEAFQMTEERRWDNSEWPNWLNKAWNNNHGEGAMWPDPDAPIAPGHESAAELVLGTLEGLHRITWGDWIIQGIKGELYPCKPGIFEATYEPVPD